MRVPKVRILGLKFNNLAYLLTMTIEIKCSSVTGKTIVKKPNLYPVSASS